MLAETRRPTLVFESSLPIRYYLPRDDVKVDLRPSPRRTTCAYKGEASYWSIDGQENLVWAYEHPLAEARELAGLVAFYDERVQVTVERGGDGVVDADMRAALAEEAATRSDAAAGRHARHAAAGRHARGSPGQVSFDLCPLGNVDAGGGGCRDDHAGCSVDRAAAAAGEAGEQGWVWART